MEKECTKNWRSVAVIIEKTSLIGKKSDLAYLDEITTKLGFVRWQWEYTRATYDYKIEDKINQAEFFLRINTRAESGKLESPDAVLAVEDVYIGRTTFPHGLDYDIQVPEPVMHKVQQKLGQLEQLLA
nr:YugN family protein [Paenibacillus larvae]